MNDNQRKLIEAIDQWEDGTLSGEEMEELTDLLAAADARQALLDHWLIERSLPQALSRAAMGQGHPLTQVGEGEARSGEKSGPFEEAPKVVRVPLWRNGFWRTFGAAAAGLVLGISSASFVFGKAATTQKKVVRILEEGFEAGAAPLAKGPPRSPGFWSGDYTELVGERSGIQPRSGARMLQVRRADYEGKPSAFSCSGDVYRMIDLRSQGVLVEDGDTVVSAEAHFRSIPFSAPKRYGVSLWVHAFENLPPVGADGVAWPPRPQPGASASMEVPTASIHRSVNLEPQGNHWQKLRTEMSVPPGTRYLMVCFHVVDCEAGRQRQESGAVEFPGQFVDDIQVTLTRGTSLR